MTVKLAAGLVVYRRVKDTIEYLLLQTSYGENHWSPPKGHLDEGEDFLEAAIRETEEESGLIENTDYIIADKDYKIEINYLVKGKPKTVVYWLAEVKDQFTKITLSDEHIDSKWLDIEKAIEFAKYETMISVLKQCDEYIKKNN